MAGSPINPKDRGGGGEVSLGSDPLKGLQHGVSRHVAGERENFELDGLVGFGIGQKGREQLGLFPFRRKIKREGTFPQRLAEVLQRELARIAVPVWLELPSTHCRKWSVPHTAKAPSGRRTHRLTDRPGLSNFEKASRFWISPSDFLRRLPTVFAHHISPSA